MSIINAYNKLSEDKITLEDVIITKVQEGSIRLNFIIRKFNEANQEAQKIIAGNEMFQHISATLGVPVDKYTSETEKTFKISIEDFNSNFDREMTGQLLKKWAGNEDY